MTMTEVTVLPRLRQSADGLHLVVNVRVDMLPIRKHRPNQSVAVLMVVAVDVLVALVAAVLSLLL